MVLVQVRKNNVDQALRVLKKKLQKEGVFREMKLRRSYEKPSEKKAREKAEAVRRARKLERKRLELARALATRPKVLLLDEIAGGLTEHEVKELIETINSIHAEGTSIIWIEHIVHALLSVVSRLIVINFGQKLDDGNPKIVIQRPEVQKDYMGISGE